MKLKALVAAVFLMSGCAAALADDAKPSWVYVLTAGKMRYTGRTLTLTRVDPAALAFTEKPFRMAHRVPTSAFVKMWAKDPASTGNNAPNGSLSMGADGTASPAAVELRHARATRGGLSFDVVVLDGRLPAKASDVSLFVDAFPTAVNSQ